MEAFQSSENLSLQPPRLQSVESLKKGVVLADSSLDLIKGTNLTSRVLGEAFQGREDIREIFSDSLLGAYYKTGDRYLLEKYLQVSKCSQEPLFFRCPNDGMLSSMFNYRCEVRGCPHCDRKRKIEKAAEVRLYMSMLNHARFITPTIAHQHGESSSDQLERLKEYAKKFRRLKAYKAHVTAAIWFYQVTHGENGWHWHLHVITDGFFWKKEELAEAWASVGGGFVDIRDADESAAQEIAHYVAKGSSFYDSPDLVAEFIRTIRGKRLSTTTGALYGVKTQIKKLAKKMAQDLEKGEFKEARDQFFAEIRRRRLRVSDDLRRRLYKLLDYETHHPEDCPICGSRMLPITIQQIYGRFFSPATVFQ